MAINIKAVVKAFNEAGIPVTADFHALSMRQVAVIAEQAGLSKYRAPKNANGSTARCFFAAVARKATALTSAAADVRAEAQAEAIAEADAHTSNTGLPSYSELLKQRDELARRAIDVLEGLEGKPLPGAMPARVKKLRTAIASCPVACPHGKGFNCPTCWPAARAA